MEDKIRKAILKIKKATDPAIIYRDLSFKYGNGITVELFEKVLNQLISDGLIFRKEENNVIVIHK